MYFGRWTQADLDEIKARAAARAAKWAELWIEHDG
jgi:hypothetical protein